MRIGIIHNADLHIPLAYTLVAQKLQVYTFFSPSADGLINQKVYGFAAQYNLPLTEEKNNTEDLYRWLAKGNFDVCFILGYNKLINLQRLENCKTDIFNIHFGPLPAYKGAVPVFWQLKKGNLTVGLAIHRLSAKFDDGPVVWEKYTENLPQHNYQTLHLLFAQQCVEGAFYILNLLAQKLPLPNLSKKGAITGYQKRPTLADVMIDWKTMPATEICNLVRACNPWNKGALSLFKGTEIKLLDARVITPTYQPPENVLPGTIVNDAETLHLICKDGHVMETNTIYLNDSFIPTYQAKQWGLLKGEKLG